MMPVIPKISINIITYNRERYLSQAIDSVLLQSFQDWELVIVDDCSTDKTYELISEYIKKDNRIKYFKNINNFGIAKSRNIALNLSVGKYIAVLDSDDYWSDNNKLKIQFDFLSNGGYVLVGCGCNVVNGRSEKKYELLKATKDSQIRNVFLIKNPFINSSVMFLKDLTIDIGGYDESLRVGEDYDLFLKLGRKGKISNINKILVNYRQHDQNISRLKLISALEDNLIIIKRYKGYYPNFLLALMKRSVRLYIAKMFFRLT